MLRGIVPARTMISSPLEMTASLARKPIAPARRLS